MILYGTCNFIEVFAGAFYWATIRYDENEMLPEEREWKGLRGQFTDEADVEASE